MSVLRHHVTGAVERGEAEPIVEVPNCEQNCGREATVYAIDPIPGGWGGRYCEPCTKALGFRVTDHLPRGSA